jgi:hypothetical protein
MSYRALMLRWWELSGEARTKGEAMRNPTSRHSMLKIADGYEQMARRASLLSGEKLPTGGNDKG